MCAGPSRRAALLSFESGSRDRKRQKGSPKYLAWAMVILHGKTSVEADE
jgi:hypothetical protein